MSKYHVPVLLKESIEHLVTDVDGIYIDVTFGGGGHSREILNRLSAKGTLIAFDQDEESKENLINDPRVIFLKSNFRHIYRFWKWLDIPKVSGVLGDLGVSSHQFDVPYRGFSYRFDAALDMRMNESSERTASQILLTYSEKDLVRIFSKYGEVRNSKQLARTIVASRDTAHNMSTTNGFNVLLDSVRIGDKPRYFAQVYQALRIEVNEEMEALNEMLTGSLRVMKDGGKMVMISYHSLEDRAVKRFVKSGNAEGIREQDDYGRFLSPIKQLGKLILPTENELKENVRSTSAKMRVAEKIRPII